MRVAVKKWGNSAAIRLPFALMSLLHIKLNSEIEMQERDGTIVLSPVNQKYCLEDLVNGISIENRHDEISFGKPVGKELL